MKNVVCVLHYVGDMKTFPYGLPDPVSFDSNFIDKRSTLIILAVGRYFKSESVFYFERSRLS